MSRRRGRWERRPVEQRVRHDLLDHGVQRRSWPETVEVARRIGVPAAKFHDHDVVDSYWPNQPPHWLDH